MKSYVRVIPSWFATVEVTFHGRTAEELAELAPLARAILQYVQNVLQKYTLHISEGS